MYELALACVKTGIVTNVISTFPTISSGMSCILSTVIVSPPREDEETSAYFKCLFPTYVFLFCPEAGENKGL